MELDKFIERLKVVQEHGLATSEEQSLLNLLKELKTARNTIASLNEKLSEAYAVENAMDEATLTDWYINSVSSEDEPVWTEAHISELTNDYVIFPKQVPLHEETKNVMEFWSNSCGELFDEKGNYITEDELPDELHKAYDTIWTDGCSSSCYLVKYQGKYGVALVNEYDDETAKNHYDKADMEQLYKDVLRKAKDFSSTPILLANNTAITVLNRAGFAGCHEIQIFVPWNTDRSLFKRLCDYVDENAYNF